MPDTKPGAPLDLSIFDNLDSSSATTSPQQPLTVAPAASLPATADPRLAPGPIPERLVEVANLSPEDLAASQASATRIDFRNTTTLLAHGEGVAPVTAAPSPRTCRVRISGPCCIPAIARSRW